MAAEPSNQKRKRGRPPGASKPQENASGRDSRKNQRDTGALQHERADDNGAGEEERPRRPGRKAAKPASEPEKEPMSASHITQTRKTRSGRKDGRQDKQPEHDMVHDSEMEEPSGRDTLRQEQVFRKRGRQSKEVPTDSRSTETIPEEGSGRAARSQEEAAAPDSGPRRSQRERRSWNPEEIFSAKITSPSTDSVSRPKKRTRSSLAEVSVTEAQNQAETSREEPPPKKRRGRPSINRGTMETAPTAKRRGRSSISIAEHAANTTEPSEPRRRGRPRASGKPTSDNEDAEPSAPSESEKPRRIVRRTSSKGAPKASPKVRRRQSGKSEQDDTAMPLSASPLPGRLTQTTRTISRSTVSSKWTPLNNNSINTISTLLGDAQRPVLLRLRDSDRRRQHASDILSLVSRRLRTKLVKGIPFPPATSHPVGRGASVGVDDEFDFERTVDATQALEGMLNPLLHSIALLERERDKEEAALEKDYATFRTLEMNARAETRTWRERARKSHVLAPEVKTDNDDTMYEHPMELVKSDKDSFSNAFKDISDEGLLSLSRQISSHMESMKGNLQQIDGVVPAITDSKAALQALLIRHLDAQQYEHVVLE